VVVSVLPESDGIVGAAAMAAAQPADTCIIGAGSSGVAVAKALKSKGIAFDCFEKGSDIGGMWRYENDNGMSSAYRSLHIDTSRKNLGYSDFPIPDDMPDFLSHWEMIRYLEAYADRFGVRSDVKFGIEITRVAPVEDGWEVATANGTVRHYRSVLVANGHLWDPRWPSFAGRLDGEVIHSHDYKTPDRFDGKNVLVVGIGNSAVDIAVDLCRRAKRVYLSTRRSAWIMPKYIMGVPVDRWGAFFMRKLKLPTRVSRSILQRLMFIAVGDQTRFGVPKPAHSMWREHATLSQELLSYVGHGWIRIKPDIRELQGDKVAFVDGSAEPTEAVIYATGYKTTFPFLAPSVFEVRDNHAPLYRRALPPDHPGLYFVGLLQPIGATIPLVEIQARWLAAVLAGEVKLPDRHTMEAEIAQHQRALDRRCVNSARYTHEVDYREYARQLRGDLKRGAAA
jgi:dimethylaniline monooxygenase (N-oxide forming)